MPFQHSIGSKRAQLMSRRLAKEYNAEDFVTCEPLEMDAANFTGLVRNKTDEEKMKIRKLIGMTNIGTAEYNNKKTYAKAIVERYEYTVLNQMDRPNNLDCIIA